ncbi:hypothetical protein KW507_15765 [Vibrio fluvialis]|uniref:hypothetical protein n=1 Tax=Vibrio fluvialis TaxID=676 RepID=UPI00192BCEB4|nr:hypothetical protein [Vibrio fluvialis]MBL4262794.1 hypothetical protein [Vibrio fluvialis]MBY8168131.1 hypothetical protein [Vibrio fluvialis]
MVSVRDIKNVHKVTDELIRQVKKEEEALRRKKSYSSSLRKYLVEIKILREDHEFKWSTIVKWLKVNHKVDITISGLKSFYFRNKDSISMPDEDI